MELSIFPPTVSLTNANRPPVENIILRGEALKELAQWPDELADGLVTDPPYSSGGLFRSDRMQTTSEKYIQSGQQKNYENFPGDNRDQRGFAYWTTLWLSECYRVLKPGSPVAIFTDWRQLPLFTDLLQAGGFVWAGVAVWDKTEGARPNLGGFRAQCEYVIWGYKGQLDRDANPVALPGYFRAPVVGKFKVHPTEKPLGLMRQVVKIVRPGGLVIDPFAGGGTTCVAAQKEGRRFLGLEYTAHYSGIAAQRLATGQSTPELFTGNPLAVPEGLVQERAQLATTGELFA